MSDIHAARCARLRALLVAADVDAALVTRLVNVRYLTGFTGSNAALLVRADSSRSAESAVLATDGRYRTQAAQEAPDVELTVDRACASALARRASADGVGRLAFEPHDVTVDLHGQLEEAAEGVALRPLGCAVEELRTTKDEDEISSLRTACSIGDRALADLLPSIRAGVTERNIARRLDSLLLDHGADAPGFDTIAASGPASALPHHRPSARPVEAGDLLVLDFGARYQGYHADMTRAFVVGAKPAGWQLDVYDLVAAAQRAGRAALTVGATCAEVDRAARSVVEAAGQGEQFVHPLGHGVGLEIHEAPLLWRESTGKLNARTPVTVEPGVYLPGQGGVRIEDTLVVRDGVPELLTTTSRELLVLG